MQYIFNMQIQFNCLFERIHSNIYAIHSLYIELSEISVNLDLNIVPYISEIIKSIKENIKSFSNNDTEITKLNEPIIFIVKHLRIKPIKILYSHIIPPSNDDNMPIYISI